MSYKACFIVGSHLRPLGQKWPCLNQENELAHIYCLCWCKHSFDVFLPLSTTWHVLPSVAFEQIFNDKCLLLIFKLELS